MSEDNYYIFVCQTVNHLIRHDFVLECINTVEYNRWRGVLDKYVTCELDELEKLFSDNDRRVFCDKKVIPVGTVEFVQKWIELYTKYKYKKEIDVDYVTRPLNVPIYLFDYCDRKIGYIHDSSEEKIRDIVSNNSKVKKWFVKDIDKIKHPDNGYYKTEELIEKFSAGRNIMISEVLCDDHEIVSEYRCFVHCDICHGIHFYNGNVNVFPDAVKIEEITTVVGMFYNRYWKNNYWGNPETYDIFGEDKDKIIDDYMSEHNCEVPRSYTLDVAVLKNGKTVVMEMHEFYSCGMYGFSDLRVISNMYINSWNKIIKRIEKLCQENVV